MAIDPGPTQSAFVLYEVPSQANPLGRVIDHLKEENDKIIERIEDGMQKGVSEFHHWPDHYVIEMIASYGMAVGEDVFETCVWIGRFMQVHKASLIQGRTHRVKRLAVKMHMCKSPKANDSTIRRALIDRWGPDKEKAIGRKKTPGPLYDIVDDEWQALALAVTFAETVLPTWKEGPGVRLAG